MLVCKGTGRCHPQVSGCPSAPPGGSWYPQPGSASAGAGVSHSKSCSERGLARAGHWHSRDSAPEGSSEGLLYLDLGTSTPWGTDLPILPVVSKEMGGFSPNLLMALFFGVTCSPGGLDW